MVDSLSVPIAVDQKARDDANAALAEIKANQRVSDERWGQTKESMQRLELGLSSINRLITRGGVGLILILLSIAGFLFVRAVWGVG